MLNVISLFHFLGIILNDLKIIKDGWYHLPLKCVKGRNKHLQSRMQHFSKIFIWFFDYDSGSIKIFNTFFIICQSLEFTAMMIFNAPQWNFHNEIDKEQVQYTNENCCYILNLYSITKWATRLFCGTVKVQRIVAVYTRNRWTQCLLILPKIRPYPS